jgi:hypothetical protein
MGERGSAAAGQCLRAESQWGCGCEALGQPSNEEVQQLGNEALML